MKSVSGDSGRSGGPGTEAPPVLAWTRMIVASAAVHLAGLVLPALLVPIYAIVAGAESAGGFAGLLSTWSLPAALWAARGARRRETPVGLLVGALVAGMLGGLFFPPTDPQSVALFALIVVAGLAGGLLAKGRP